MAQSGKRWATNEEHMAGMLLGQYRGTIGDKGRIAIPKKFREILGDNLIITFGYENSLIVVSEQGWKTLTEGTEGRPFIHSQTRDTQRFLLGGATLVSLDNKGRFVIPSYLRSFAGIGDEVVFLGLSRYVEMWDSKRWLAHQKFLEKNIESIAKKLIRDEEARSKK